MQNSLSTYCHAQLAADQDLLEESKTRSDFPGISLRPWLLSNALSGLISLGKTESSLGTISRRSVAKVIAMLAEDRLTKTVWLDLLDGSDDAEAAINFVVRNNVDSSEGEIFNAIAMRA